MDAPSNSNLDSVMFNHLKWNDPKFSQSTRILKMNLFQIFIFIYSWIRNIHGITVTTCRFWRLRLAIFLLLTLSFHSLFEKRFWFCSGSSVLDTFQRSTDRSNRFGLKVRGSLPSSLNAPGNPSGCPNGFFDEPSPNFSLIPVKTLTDPFSVVSSGCPRSSIGSLNGFSTRSNLAEGGFFRRYSLCCRRTSS